MKLAVSMWSYFHATRDRGLDIPGFIREAKRAGADGVELLDFFYGPDRSAKTPAIDEALEETGLPVPIFSVSNDFAQLDPAKREAALDRIRFGVDEAVHYGAGTVRVFAGDVKEGVTFDQARTWIVEGLRQGAVYAGERGVRLALENHGTLAGRSDQVRGLLNDIDHPAIGANPDTGNFQLVGQLGHEAIRDVADLAAMVHFKDFAPEPAGYHGFAYTALDGSRWVGTAVGEGAVDLGACISALSAKGFDGWLSVEYEGEEDPFTAVPRSIENAKRFSPA
ncbi:sugar phosphate isomerase/epimerase [bacterium]|nr:MAG: sugar phosphate isomerase/epimerase [bacterium]